LYGIRSLIKNAIPNQNYQKTSKRFMKYFFTLFLLNFFCITAFCQNKLLKGTNKIPDSISAIAYYAEIKVTAGGKLKNNIAGITANTATVGLAYNKNQKIIQFHFFDNTMPVVAFGKDAYQYGLDNAWNYYWKDNETYALLIATASDSASHKTLYSGYIFLSNEKKWKLIATRSYNDTNGIKFIGNKIPRKSDITFSNRWLQRSNGSWKALDAQTTKPPSLRQMSNIDSLIQQKEEEEILRSKLPKDSIVYEEGMFYQTLKQGSGKIIKVSDTLTVNYRGSLFSDGSIFDETKDKPATFPLERLIKGWQLGLVHCRVGGKMRLFIPSGIAYGIRTRSAEIPPNSILVFDVEVLDAKEKIVK
jgi:FKBP-type peptidyl-prolyl cis-trans isomerase FkpA